MMDVSEIFDDPDFAKEVDFEIGEGSFDVEGKWWEAYRPTSLIAIVHATKPDDLLLLPEGERYLPTKKVFTREPVKIGDLMMYQGARWRISALSDWSEYGFFNGVAVRHDGLAKPGATAFIVA